MDRRFAVAQNERILDLIESSTGKKIDCESKEKILQGPNELALVRSGLEDTMREAYSEIKEMHLSNSKINDRRTASFALAIRKIADTYDSMYL